MPPSPIFKPLYVIITLMISKYTEKNKFGGQTWHIKLNSLFHVFIMETNQDSYIVEIKEWLYFNYKIRKIFISSNDFPKTVIESINELQKYLNETKKYLWQNNEKDYFLNSILNELKYEEEKKEKAKNSFFASLTVPQTAPAADANNDDINSDIFNTAEFWTLKALEALKNKNYSSSKNFIHIAYQIDSDNIDICLLYLTLLIIKDEYLSLYEIRNNLNKARKINNSIMNKIKNNHLELDHRQEKRYNQIMDEYLEFSQYVVHLEWKHSTGFY